ncbi:MAG: hypothetical protein K9L26_02585 [Candidatus Izimaplasma sp.]|nr:hypothetical protein [Candidatus Izimaplasma bacterium]
MNRLISICLMFLSVLTLVGCNQESVVQNNFKARQNSFFIDSTQSIIITYETNNKGVMTSLDIDKLLTIEEMLLYNQTIDYDIVVDGFNGDVFVEARNACTDISNSLMVPKNLEVGNTRYKYNEADCQYQIVDSYNQFKTGYAQEYYITDTIPVSHMTAIKIVVYDADAIVRFIDVYTLYNSVKDLGLDTILINDTKDGFDSEYYHYYQEIRVYEQLYLKHQTNATTINEINGFSEEINILNIGDLEEISPVIEDFNERFIAEINALNELESDIGVTSQATEETTND